MIQFKIESHVKGEGEHELNPDISFVISGDEFNISSLSILKSCIKRNITDSKRIGIFISCYGYQYPKNWLKYTFLKLRLKQKIKYFDIKYWLDEYFVKNTSIDSSIWLPDISKSFNVGDSIEDSDNELLCGQIDDFLNNNEEKEILLFFGRDFIRKGFDYLVKSSSHRIIAGDKVYVGWNRLLINRGTYFYAFSHTPAHKLKLPKKTFTVTIIRDPVKRVISHYKMLVEMKQNSIDHPCMDTEGKWLGENFNDFLDNIPKTDPLNQLYMFSESYDIDEAYNNIINCSHFFLTEKFDKGITDLSSKMGLDLNPIHIRKSSIDVHISSYELEKLESLLEPEIKLYKRLEKYY